MTLCRLSTARWCCSRFLVWSISRAENGRRRRSRRSCIRIRRDHARLPRMEILDNACPASAYHLAVHIYLRSSLRTLHREIKSLRIKVQHAACVFGQCHPYFLEKPDLSAYLDGQSICRIESLWYCLNVDRSFRSLFTLCRSLSSQRFQMFISISFFVLVSLLDHESIRFNCSQIKTNSG
jgi:hypothetical protein